MTRFHRSFSLESLFAAAGNIVKKGRAKGLKYNMDIRLKSKPFTGKLSGFVNVADATSTKLTLDYNVYRMGRDRVTINGKLSNKSTAAFKKYTLSSYVSRPTWPFGGLG